MTTRSRMTKKGLFDGPAWPRDNSSDFECDSPPGSPIFSSGYESVISEDLDLYEASLGVELTDDQIGGLNGRVEEFRAAGYEDREIIVEDFFGSFMSAYPQGIEPEEVILKTLIRQHLYGQVKPVAKASTPNTQSQVVEECQETALTDQHISMLERWVPKFRAADTTGREKLVDEVAERIKRAWTENTEFDRDAVICLIREHLYGKLKRGMKKSAFETRKWSYRDVYTAMHRKKIYKLTTKLSKNKPGSPNYLRYYNKARKQVEEKLTENQRQRYKRMAKEWSEKKLPPQMQRRMMIKNGPRAVKEFTTSAYNQFGMRVVVLAAYIDGEGDPSITLFDYNDQNGGTSFKACHENWRQSQLVEDFSKWGVRSLGASLTDGSEDESSRKKDKPEIKLKRNKDGYPLLPNLEEIAHHGLLYKKRLIGKFVGDVYETSISAGKERVPWAELQRAQDNYIKQKYLPKEVTLQQYYHLRQKDVDAILKHWTQRQAAGKVPLRFKKVAKAIRQNARTSEENDAATHEPYEVEEERLEDDRGSQAPQGGGSQRGEGGNGSPEPAHPGQGLGNAAEDSNGHSPHSPENGQGADQPIIAADAHAPQQTGQTDEPSAEDGQEPSQNETQTGADDIQRPPAASPNQANERQQSPPALPSGSREIRGGHQRRRKNDGDAADSPLRKRQKVNSQVDGAGDTRRRSNRDRRPTTKAANDSAVPYGTRLRSRR